MVSGVEQVLLNTKEKFKSDFIGLIWSNNVLQKKRHVSKASKSGAMIFQGDGMSLYVVWWKVVRGRLGEHFSKIQRGGECY